MAAEAGVLHFRRPGLYTADSQFPRGSLERAVVCCICVFVCRLEMHTLTEKLIQKGQKKHVEYSYRVSALGIVCRVWGGCLLFVYLDPWVNVGLVLWACQSCLEGLRDLTQNPVESSASK